MVEYLHGKQMICVRFTVWASGVEMKIPWISRTELHPPGDRDDEQFYECDCCTHALQITWLDDLKMASFELWTMRDYNRRSLFERVRAAWKMLRHGYVYGDLIFEREQLIAMRDQLNRIIESDTKRIIDECNAAPSSKGAAPHS